MVILIATKIMTSIVPNLDILSPLHHQMVKFVQQVAILKFLVMALPENMPGAYAKSIHLSVILNVVTMILVWLIQIQINVQLHRMNQHLTPMTQHVPLQLKLDVKTLLIISVVSGMHVKLIWNQLTTSKVFANLKHAFGPVMMMKQR